VRHAGEILRLLLDQPDNHSAAAVLRDRYGLSEWGAAAVLDLSFRQVTVQMRERLDEEVQRTRARLASP
jgi:hypothetical protein